MFKVQYLFNEEFKFNIIIYIEKVHKTYLKYKKMSVVDAD